MIDLKDNHIDGRQPSKEAFPVRRHVPGRRADNPLAHLHSIHLVAVSCHVDPNDVLPPLTAYKVMRVGRLPLPPTTLQETARRAGRIRRCAQQPHPDRQPSSRRYRAAARELASTRKTLARSGILTGSPEIQAHGWPGGSLRCAYRPGAVASTRAGSVAMRMFGILSASRRIARVEGVVQPATPRRHQEC